MTHEKEAPLAHSNPDIVHLRRAGVSVVLATGGGRLPRIIHWGADLGALDDAGLAALTLASKPPIGHNLMDQVWDISVLPDFESGWLGQPGVDGSRDGRDWSPAFQVTDLTVTTDLATEDGRIADAVTATAEDESVGLGVVVELQLLATGLLRGRATLTNRAAGTYTVGALRLVFPVPTEADELLDFTGRHLMERVPQRSNFPVGIHSREERGGRTGLDAAALLIAGRAGFGFRRGEVWGTHVAYSGNQHIYGERIYNGARVLGGGELLQHGEIELAVGESYASPWFFGSYADGLDAMASRFHEHVRSRPGYPSSPRPVVVNTWEAVYFDHDVAVLNDIADIASDLGIERFILDDGWFGSRRDDKRGLGDWTVSSEVWPDGLHPLIDHVKSRGMDFGLWVEPEMVNLDSDLARAHPEWLFGAGGRVGSSSRNQHVLDLGHPEAYAFIRDALVALLDEYDIAYLKWDHNRQLVETGHTPTGRPGNHDQTLAVYRLMDELKAHQPGLEIESCASGGGRIDLGILEHTERVWGSDTNDPLERQQIHRWMKLLVPPELIGAHIGASPSHTTGRMQNLQFRAETAFWNHLGIELDLRSSDDEERGELRSWIALYRATRELLHTGTVVNADHPDESIWVSGIVSPDQQSALFGVAAMTRSVAWPPGRVRLPGLDPDARYRVETQTPAKPDTSHTALPEWMAEPLILTGRALETAGIQLAPIRPENAYLLKLTAL
jgi:alpha-galactosidase